MAAVEPTDALVLVRRKPERGSTDRQLIDAILDAGVLCHLGYQERGRPVVVPTLFARLDDQLVLHGSAASRAMRAGAASLPICATVTLLDGLVLARSANNHSANYRSVVVHGDATPVIGREAKLAALAALTEHVSPGRWAQVRPPDEQELRSTTVLSLPLTHAVAKVREGGVIDQERDHHLDVWAGVVPVGTRWDAAVPDAGVAAHLAPPVWHAEGRPTGVPAAPRDVRSRRQPGTDEAPGTSL